jgi:hypothetical protein
MEGTSRPSGWIPKVERSVERDRFDPQRMVEAYELVVPIVRSPIGGKRGPGQAESPVSAEPRIRQVSGA